MVSGGSNPFGRQFFRRTTNLLRPASRQPWSDRSPEASVDGLAGCWIRKCRNGMIGLGQGGARESVEPRLLQNEKENER